MTSTLKAYSQGALVLLAATGSLAAFNLAVAVEEALQQFNIFVVNVSDFFCAEAADFFIIEVGHEWSPLYYVIEFL